MDYIEITIRKPLYNNFVNIREKFLLNAIKENKMIKVNIPQGSAIHNPSEWMKTGKHSYQEFLIKGCPMSLWGNYVKI